MKMILQQSLLLTVCIVVVAPLGVLAQAVSQDPIVPSMGAVRNLDESCSYEGRILMKPTNEKITKLRLKVSRPLDSLLELKSNNISATTALTEQRDDGFTYFTVMPDSGFMTIPDNGFLLDFSIKDTQAVNRISMGEESYIQLLDGNKVYVTEEPIYLEFVPITCVKKSDSGFMFSEVSPSTLVLRTPDMYALDDLVVMVSGIPYELNDVMVSQTSGGLLIEPIVPLEVNTPIQLVVRNKKNGDELFSKQHTILQELSDEDARLASIVSKSQEERQEVIRGPIGSITLQECDILNQLEDSVVEVNRPQIEALRQKLQCPTDNVVAGAIAFDPTHSSAGDEGANSNQTSWIATLGWILFALFVTLHVAQKVRRKQHLLNGDYDYEEEISPYVSRRGSKKTDDVSVHQDSLEEVETLKSELNQAQQQLRMVYDHAKQLEQQLTDIRANKTNSHVSAVHSDLTAAQEQLKQVHAHVRKLESKLDKSSTQKNKKEMELAQEELRYAQEQLLKASREVQYGYEETEDSQTLSSELDQTQTQLQLVNDHVKSLEKKLEALGDTKIHAESIQATQNELYRTQEQLASVHEHVQGLYQEMRDLKTQLDVELNKSATDSSDNDANGDSSQPHVSLQSYWWEQL